MNREKVLLVGTGPMAVEYAKVLQSLGFMPVTVGRGAESANKFQAETGLPVFRGGLDAWLTSQESKSPKYAIVAVGEKWIGACAISLMDNGYRTLLLEKPGGHNAEDIRSVNSKAIAASAEVFVGYNRRFYASVDAARRIISEDGGVTSFNFEFTEWAHVIAGIEKEEGVKEQWFLSNSTHVIDLAFFLGGFPSEMVSFSAGGLEWHPAASIFAGAGKTHAGAIFSYQANWQAPGRWGVEVLTHKHRLILRPLEKLQIQKIGSVTIEAVEIDDRLDREFKPGLYKQVRTFLAKDREALPTIFDQVVNLDYYLKIRGDRS